MKEKLKYKFRKLRKSIIEYIATNRLFITYVILSMIGLTVARKLIIQGSFNIKPFMVDLAVVIMLGSFGYLAKPKNRNRYYLFALIIFSAIEIINSIYYKFYPQFASFAELSTLSQAGTVKGSIFHRLVFTDIMYALLPIIFILIHKNLVKTTYYNLMSMVEKGKKMFGVTFIVGFILLSFHFVDASKIGLVKQWNREGIVNRMGLSFYQFNDLVQSLIPKISSMFGYEASVQKFLQYYTDPENNKYKENNEYTNILKDKNIIFIHMEGIQTYLMDLKFNDVEVTPNLNKIASEGMFFENFYPQISTGTSSDTEFTILTSLLPSASGTIFTSYYNREYVTLPNLLKQEGYATFSMHGNAKTMWNRDKVHPLLGYQDMYFEEYFEYNRDREDENNKDIINLGINDKLFFKQAIPLLENYEKLHEKYMGTIITLSNHSPFIYDYGTFDKSTTYLDCTETCKNVTSDYLEGTPVGNYITSSHYADSALGEFFTYINESNYFDDTIFVLYGDHDVKLSQNEVNYLYNYDPKTGKLKDEEDPTYKEYDYYDHELNKNTPLIIWTKNKELKNTFKGKVSYMMGMYDVMPTLGNMLGLENEYALGHDIFNIKNENVVIFPNGNFATNLVYYKNASDEFKVLKPSVAISSDYISKLKIKAEKTLDVSNAIELHDLIAKEKERLHTLKNTR